MEIINFFLDEQIDDKKKKRIKELSKTLKKVGVEMQIYESESGMQMLAVEVDLMKTNTVIEQHSRNAGRKKKAQRLGCITPQEFLQKVEENGVDRVAEEYDISRRTVYRRIKLAKEEEEELFWNE